jgi:hypothetical protein
VLKARNALLLDYLKIHISLQLSYLLCAGIYERTTQTERMKRVDEMRDKCTDQSVIGDVLSHEFLLLLLCWAPGS